MLRRLERHITSKASPINGTAPTTLSSATLPSMRTITWPGAPSWCASCTIHSDIAVVTASPMPGTRPISASRPKRILVPGRTTAVPSSVASASMRAPRPRRERGRAKSKPKSRKPVLLVAMGNRWAPPGSGASVRERQPANYRPGTFVPEPSCRGDGQSVQRKEDPMRQLTPLVAAVALLIASPVLAQSQSGSGSSAPSATTSAAPDAMTVTAYYKQNVYDQNNNKIG